MGEIRFEIREQHGVILFVEKDYSFLYTAIVEVVVRIGYKFFNGIFGGHDDYDNRS